MADDALNAHEAGGSLLAPRSGGTLICCPVCAAAVQRGFSKVFYGRRIDPRTGREVPLTHELLPNDAASLSEEDILDNSTSLRSYLAHFLLEHPDIEYEVSTHALQTRLEHLSVNPQGYELGTDPSGYS